MKVKRIVHILTVLFLFGIVTFFVPSLDAQTTEDTWETWIDEQTDIVLKSAEEMDDAQRSEMRASIRAKFAALAAELKNEIASPPQAQDYAILQTVKELQNTYDADYNRKYKDTTVRVSYKVSGAEIFAYDENIPIAEVDAKYPREAWLQMLLEKGITIKNADAYWEYLFLRDTLVRLEKQPQVWTSGLFDIPATEDWETYKAAYIARELGEIQKRLKNEQQAKVSDIEIVLNARRLLEKDGDIELVLRELEDIQKEIPSLTYKSNRIVVVPQTVKALRDAYDKKYNEKYAITSGSVSYKLEGKPVFKYEVPLPISEVDAKYPRDEWLQMLLNKGITIDNFEEYWTYLSKRDELVALEKAPKVWSSELFGISPTDDWETYKAAYLKQMFEKLHQNDRNQKHKVYFGEDAEVVLKRAREHIEELERYKPLLRDR